MTNASTKSGGTDVPFMAFTSDGETALALKQFAASHNWPESIIHSGDIDAAAQFLKTNHSPKVLFVDVTSAADKVSASLDALADVCEPGIKVIVSGRINEYSFYCWLVDVGISSYLLKPFKLAALETAYGKASDVPQAGSDTKRGDVKKEARIITILGARGGVGATTVSVNTAWILAKHYRQKVALLDFDAQLGTVALALDLEPSKGMRDALEKPDRIDSLFIDRVMIRVDEHLSILSTEEALEENLTSSEGAAANIIKQIRPKFSHILIDLPRTLNPFTRYTITHADDVVCVTEYTIAGLRESLRYLEYCRDVLKRKPPIFVANRVGLAGKHQMPQEEFEKGLGQKVAFNIPFILDAHAAATSGEVLAEIAPKNAPAVKMLHTLSGHFMDGLEAAEQKPAKSLLSMLKGGK